MVMQDTSFGVELRSFRIADDARNAQILLAIRYTQRRDREREGDI